MHGDAIRREKEWQGTVGCRIGRMGVPSRWLVIEKDGLQYAVPAFLRITTLQAT
jgi:hypothetical protein